MKKMRAKITPPRTETNLSHSFDTFNGGKEHKEDTTRESQVDKETQGKCVMT